MCFNPDRTKPAEEVIFTNKNSTTYEIVTFASADVEPVFYHKHLGFVLDSKMNYSKHIDEKIAKAANQGIGVSKRLYNYLPRKVLLQIYTSYIRPNLAMLYITSDLMMIFIVHVILKEPKQIP